MKRMVTTVLLAVAVVGGLSGCATMPPGQRDSNMADSGYFLSLKQKGQLIGSGRIQDKQGCWYDVWIVPGYVDPAQRSKKYLQRTGSDFAEYVQPEKYRDLAEASGSAFVWAYDDWLVDFTVKGLPRAWDCYWSAANRRTRQRTFGWWLAYPWAFLESTVDTAVRVPVGLAGTALCTVGGVAIVPGYYALNSAAKGTWHFGVDAVLFPAVACTWNTVVAPPMAMVGQKPSPARVDGFWVRQLGKTDVRAISAAETPVTPKDVEALAVWGCLLLTASQPYEDRRQDLRKQTQAEHEAINRKAQQAKADIQNAEKEAVRAMVDDPLPQETLDYLRSRSFDPKRTSQAAGDVRRYLEVEKKLSLGEINRILILLDHYPLSATTNQPLRLPKTDPVQRSVDVIKDIL